MAGAPNLDYLRTDHAAQREFITKARARDATTRAAFEASARQTQAEVEAPRAPSLRLWEVKPQEPLVARSPDGQP